MMMFLPRSRIPAAAPDPPPALLARLAAGGLANVRRGEPEPALLKVPADYTRGEAGERPAPRASAPRG
jgi:hypothetical protein